MTNAGSALRPGTYRVDRTRSAFYMPNTRNFPKNTEVEVLLTFESDAPGSDVARHTPDARALTLREHYPEAYNNLGTLLHHRTTER